MLNVIGLGDGVRGYRGYLVRKCEEVLGGAGLLGVLGVLWSCAKADCCCLLLFAPSTGARSLSEGQAAAPSMFPSHPFLSRAVVRTAGPSPRSEYLPPANDGVTKHSLHSGSFLEPEHQWTQLQGWCCLDKDVAHTSPAYAQGHVASSAIIFALTQASVGG